jgi:hypothetical protein
VTVLTLALSIGANTAILSMVNPLMLKRLPYSQPERTGTIFTRVTGPMHSNERHHLNSEQWDLLGDDVLALISAVSGIRDLGRSTWKRDPMRSTFTQDAAWRTTSMS